MLDMKMLEAMPAHTIFASGITNLTRLWKDDVRWVAKKGGVVDWAIYYHKAEYDMEYVAAYGDKCFTKEVIRELVPCTDNAFKRYRY